MCICRGCCRETVLCTGIQTLGSHKSREARKCGRPQGEAALEATFCTQASCPQPGAHEPSRSGLLWPWPLSYCEEPAACALFFIWWNHSIPSPLCLLQTIKTKKPLYLPATRLPAVSIQQFEKIFQCERNLLCAQIHLHILKKFLVLMAMWPWGLMHNVAHDGRVFLNHTRHHESREQHFT